MRDALLRFDLYEKRKRYELFGSDFPDRGDLAVTDRRSVRRLDFGDENRRIVDGNKSIHTK